MWIVVIEWDGKKPPMSFYNRLHKLGLYVKGDKIDANGADISPLKRRSIEDGSVIAQEGAIMCASATLAGYIAAKAEENGAKVVSIAEVNFEPYKMTADDAKIFNRVESIYSRKGRPSGHKVDWAVTCLEEAMTYPTEGQSWVECPYCSGLNTRGRVGTMDEYSFPTGNVFLAWQRHRFVHGEFEVPTEPAQHGQYPPPLKPIEHDAERRVVEMMGNCTELMEQVGKLHQHTAARVLDGVLVAKAHIPEEKRRKKRVEAVVNLFERGVDASRVKLVESPTSVDMLDAAAVIGAENVSQLWLAVNINAAKEN